MNKWKNDVAVLLIFFVRDDTFAKVFESVRAARPRILLLWQDGPREGRSDDMEGIKKCRKIAESVDWDCEVHTNYHLKNMGCDPSTHYAHKWAFSIVDKCIVLEDDQVPDQSFYPYCTELLNRYENDERISHICGYNFLGSADWCPNDYLFSYTGSGAWASWRRVAEKWDSEYSFLDDEYTMSNLRFHYGKRANYWLGYAKRHRESGIAHWESILGMGIHMQSQYAIIPKVNLVQNCGISKNATHSTVDDINLIPKSDRAFYREAASLSFPLRHPTTVLPDAGYVNGLAKISSPSLCNRVRKYIEMSVLMLKRGDISLLIKRTKKKLFGK